MALFVTQALTFISLVLVLLATYMVYIFKVKKASFKNWKDNEGREYADNSMWGSAKEDNQVRENKANTCVYVNDFRTIRKTTIRYITLLLLNKKLTIKDLNYPKYWIDKGFQ